MSGARVGLTRLAGDEGTGDLLVLGAGLGTRAATLWAAVAERSPGLEIVGVDLPGHGIAPATVTPFTVADLADDLRTRVTDVLGADRSAWYAGVSMAGATAFELARDPGPFRGLVALAASATIGTRRGWAERAALVRRAGTPALVSTASTRWFADGFAARSAGLLGDMLHDLCAVDDESYALCCEALATYDGRGATVAGSAPFLLAPGEHDPVVPPEQVRQQVPAGASLQVVRGCAHQPPAEVPAEVADLLAGFLHENGGRRD